MDIQAVDTENQNPEMKDRDAEIAPTNSKSIIEAILFAASQPITVKQFQHAIPGITAREIRSAIATLCEDYEQTNRSFHLIEIAKGYQICTRPEYSEYIRKFYIQQVRVTLSPSALETLAIVAYKQPVTRADVSNIRGVNSDSVINSLVEKDLVCVSGRKEGAGRSLLFSTTDTFLQQFGLKDPSELPSLEEIEQLMSNAKGQESEFPPTSINPNDKNNHQAAQEDLEE